MENNEPLGELQRECNMRRFFLRRDEDDSGVSGTGIVAEGVELSNGKVILTFRSHLGSVQVLDSMKVLKHTSVHKGSSKIVWIDPEPFESEETQTDRKNDDPTEDSSSE